MSGLLTKSEYGALATSLSLPAGAFIDGKLQNHDCAMFDSVNPATGDVIASLPVCDADIVDQAVGKARQAFESGIG